MDGMWVIFVLPEFVAKSCEGMKIGRILAIKTKKVGKMLKKSPEKFGGKEKVRIFAVRLRNNGSSLKILKD